ncbi:CASP C terminal-domain-containing protein [Piptocephalis cylindrospora]|uniref:Protein CASP n=1 Tax=Piptocephalis cylindrospora TaxID=1907219 RepID=A0A4P9Y803_9FUNG|nr:CASP C terminal-domain-containing protein [Piptocephalis cylindrospora]|eukprot:RKP14080.1 CASP C terminal-domain-containing protein [Piptocephalis cylindrospora]
MASNLLDAALERWKEVDFNALQSQLESQSEDILKIQGSSTASRKALAEKTKEFRKVSDEEKLSSLKSLLKSYQQEIDQLTKRSKSSESILLDTFHRLGDIPDPMPILGDAKLYAQEKERSRELEEGNEALTLQCKEIQEELSKKLTEEGEVRKLKKTLKKLEDEMEERVKTQVGAKEADILEKAELRVQQAKSREEALEKQLDQVRQDMLASKRTADALQARLLSSSSPHGGERATPTNSSSSSPAISSVPVQESRSGDGSATGEANYLVRELEKANIRILELEKEVKNNLGPNTSGGKNEDLIKKLEERDQRITQLEVELLSLRNKISESGSESTSRLHPKHILGKPQNDPLGLVSTEQKIQELTKKLEDQSDYHVIRQEWTMLRSMEFSDQDISNGPSANEEASGGNESLEVLILRKNRRLEREMSALRSKMQEEQGESTKTKEALKGTLTQLEKYQRIVEKLEEDVDQLQAPSNTRFLLDAPTSTRFLDGLDAKGAASGVTSASTTRSSSPSISHPHSPLPPMGGPTGGGEASLIPILKGQRDRFKARNVDLEWQMKKSQQQIQDLESRLSSLHADNVQLYERLRFHQESAAPSRAEDHPIHEPSPWTSIHMDTRGEENQGMVHRTPKISTPMAHVDHVTGQAVADRYKKAYEDRLDPFAHFHRQEAERVRRALNPVDRLLLTMARLLLGTRLTRLLFLAYVSILHLLVLASLFQASSDNLEPLPGPVH